MHVDWEDIKKLSNINLIDIRNHYSYNLGTILNARNIFSDELLYHTDKYLKKEETYYLFCESGTRSYKLSRLLNSLGYNTYSIDGGYNKYILEK